MSALVPSGYQQGSTRSARADAEARRRCDELDGGGGGGRGPGISGHGAFADMSRRSVLFGALGLGGIAVLGLPSLADARQQPLYQGMPPAGRMYCGVKVDVDSNDPTQIEAELDFVDGLHRSYFVPGQEAALVAKAKLDLSKRRLPWTSIHVPGTWQDMAAGVYDDWLASMLAPLKKMSGPVWFTLHHEPWDDQGAGCTPATYVDMYRHVFTMTTGTNVALVPILQSWPFYSWVQNPSNILDWFDPATCDVLGLDAYNQWYAGAPDSAWKTPDQILDVASQLTAAFPGKPIAYGEWGVRTDTRSPGKAAAWMKDFYTLALDADDCVGICYYSSALNSPHGPWILDGERLAAFDDLVHDSRTASRIPGRHSNS